MEVTSTYLPKFQTLSKEVKDGFVLRANLILVEKIVIEKKTKSNIILASKQDYFGSMQSAALDFHIVVAVGEGYEDSDGKNNPALLECKVGDIVCMSSTAVNYLSYFGAAVGTEAVDKIGIARSSDIFMVWNGKEGFEAFFKEFDK